MTSAWDFTKHPSTFVSGKGGYFSRLICYYWALLAVRQMYPDTKYDDLHASNKMILTFEQISAAPFCPIALSEFMLADDLTQKHIDGDVQAAVHFLKIHDEGLEKLESVECYSALFLSLLPELKTIKSKKHISTTEALELGANLASCLYGFKWGHYRDSAKRFEVYRSNGGQANARTLKSVREVERSEWKKINSTLRATLSKSDRAKKIVSILVKNNSSDPPPSWETVRKWI